MSLLLRTLACLVVAISMAALSFAAAAHSAVVLDEAVPHASVVGAELPCPDCGTHQSIGCSQACSATAEQPASGVPLALPLVALDFAPRPELALDGALPVPLVTPPIG
jgi:hypothetical protein